ncbi:Uncharacterized protein dnm_034790 [Desulfonema magnum]|uniref:Uncharacterized protein n=1 Tax=Desulfonema magnum TaxID=45655 RepID=A0A975BLW5_9BACT|nr:Uncharacterized protein dnm_034790 [Desulfonema magnum]
MKKPGFSSPVMKIFSDKKPGFSKCIFTLKYGSLSDRYAIIPILVFSGYDFYERQYRTEPELLSV